MAARELLAELAGQGFSVAADGENLLIRPASALTEELRERLRACKPELVQALRGSPELPPEPPPGPRLFGNVGVAADIAPRPLPELALRLMRCGWPELDALALAERVAQRDLADDRRTCLECSAHQPGRCRTPSAAGLSGPLVGLEWAALDQRCTGFKERSQDWFQARLRRTP